MKIKFLIGICNVSWRAAVAGTTALEFIYADISFSSNHFHTGVTLIRT